MGRILNRLKDLEDIKIKKDKSEEIELIPLSRLKLQKNRVRKSINREKIDLMSKNLKLFGILQPLEINHKNEIVLGTRRFEAAKLASLDKIPVIKRSSNDLYEIEKQLISDIHTDHPSLLEKAKAFQLLLEVKDVNKTALARYLGLSSNLICRTLSILEASPETLSLMKK